MKDGRKLAHTVGEAPDFSPVPSTVCYSRCLIQVHRVERCLELLLIHRTNFRSNFSSEISFRVWKILKQG